MHHGALWPPERLPSRGVPGIAWHGHLTHSQRLCIPSSWGLCNWEAASCIEGSGPGSLVKGRCPVASVWLCGWTTFPPCTSAKGMLNRLEKKNREEKLGMPCSRPGSLPHAAASSTRLEFKECQQRQLFGPSNIGVHLGFPWEQSGRDPPLALLCSVRTCLGLLSKECYQKRATQCCPLPGWGSWAVSPSLCISTSPRDAGLGHLFFRSCRAPSLHCKAQDGQGQGNLVTPKTSTLTAGEEPISAGVPWGRGHC